MRKMVNRLTRFALSAALLFVAGAGNAQTTSPAGYGPSGPGPLPGVVSVNNLPISAVALAAVFGTGADGSLNISSGTVSLAREFNYTGVTINGTGHLAELTGHWIRANATCDLSGAPAGAIFSDVSSSHVYNASANNAAGATGGSANGGCFGDHSDAPGSTCAGAGKNAGTGAGTAGTQDAQGTAQYLWGGRGGASGAGGSASGGGTAGGAAAAQQSAAGFGFNLSLTALDPRPVYFLTEGTPSSVQVSGSGAVGGSGAGDGTNVGGASGGAGAGGGELRIACATLNRGASTAASAISALGMNAGNGGNSAGGNAAGGGGSAAGGGGNIHFVTGQRIGAIATNMLDSGGGNGGNAGAGTGTGNGGDGGNGGNCGQIDAIDLATNTFSHPITGDSAGSAGTAHSGTTPGVGGAGCNGKANW